MKLYETKISYVKAVRWYPNLILPFVSVQQLAPEIYKLTIQDHGRNLGHCRIMPGEWLIETLSGLMSTMADENFQRLYRETTVIDSGDAPECPYKRIPACKTIIDVEVIESGVKDVCTGESQPAEPQSSSSSSRRFDVSPTISGTTRVSGVAEVKLSEGDSGSNGCGVPGCEGH